MSWTVRIGELAVASTAGDELTALGLGSCIGLALVDRDAGVVGIAHIMLPASSGEQAVPNGKFADSAVPALIAGMIDAGASEVRLEAVLAGGACMFDLGNELDIGARNESAVRSALARAGIAVRAATTGGNLGRTLRAVAGRCTVTVRAAGGESITLLSGAEAPTEEIDTGAQP